MTLSMVAFSQDNFDEKLVGKHLLALQWISWDYFGDANITATDTKNTYKIEGLQKSKDNTDYLKIEGTLTALSEDHLVFNGLIETSVSHLNEGTPCPREGEYHFKARSGRKYWRLQELNNPCDNVADYVDIFFSKKD